MANNFVWYELMTTDAKAARDFYGKVAGWKPQDAAQPSMDYTLLLAGDAPMAGLMTLPKEACDAGAKPAWVGYDWATSRRFYPVQDGSFIERMRRHLNGASA